MEKNKSVDFGTVPFCSFNKLKKNFFLMFIFERERERGHEHEQGRSRERETQNPKQAAGSELSSQSLMRGSNSQTMRS